ncbi:MAG: hypothetical protein Q8Q54_00060 [Methylococcales bacterium]|nr:hypothetical protein [Methylococcales bacterium]MDP3837297.1 hypothetical protein [Methylococcales bacterium]
MSSVTFEYMGYENLSVYELNLIQKFFTGDFKEEAIDALMQSDTPLSKDMKRFIADILTGRVKQKKKGRPDNTRRDISIYNYVSEGLSDGEKLTSNKDEDGVAQGVADMMELSVDTVIKAYQKIKNGGGYDNPLYFIMIKTCDDDGVILYHYRANQYFVASDNVVY